MRLSFSVLALGGVLGSNVLDLTDSNFQSAIDAQDRSCKFAYPEKFLKIKFLENLKIENKN